MALSQKEFEQLKKRLILQKQRRERQKPLSQRFLGFGAGITGIQSAVELAAPAAELFALGGSFLQGEAGRKFRQKRLLGKPLGKASQVAEEKGLGKGLQTVAGQTIKTAAEAAPFVVGGLGTTGLTGKGIVGNRLINFSNSFVGRSAEIAFAKSVGEGIENDEESGKILMEASVKGLVAASISFLLGKAGEKLIERFEKSATRLTGRALNTSVKKIQSDIEQGRKTLNTDIVNEGYFGTTNRIRNQAVNNLEKFGDKIDDIVVNAKGTINKKDVISVFDDLIENNVTLELSQLNLIIKQIDKIPEKMSVAQANQFKIQFAKLVPKNAWDLTSSQTDTFRSQLFKAISKGFRKEVEKKVPQIAGINEKWSIALDVLGLSSKQLAKKEVSGGLGERVESGLFRLASETIAAPFIATVTRTTRAQILNALNKAGQTELARTLAKILIVKAESK